MKIAILVPTPHTKKGEDVLAKILCASINENTYYEAELVQFPMSKNTSYDRDFSYYDIVIGEENFLCKIRSALENANSVYIKASDNENLFIKNEKSDKAEENLKGKKILLVSSGVDTTQIKFVSLEQRKLNKLKKGIGNEKIALSIGELNGKDIDGAEKILNISSFCPDTKFILMGKQCENFKYRDLPKNIGLLGEVNERKKLDILSTIDFAINPVIQGNLVNSRMLEYMAVGVPIITTSSGVLGMTEKKMVTIANTNYELINAVNDFDSSKEITRVTEAREYVEHTRKWHMIAKGIEKELENI